MDIKLEKPLDDSNESNVISVAVRYSKGGINYFSGGVNKRGLSVRVAAERVDEVSRSFVMFGNKLDFSAFLLPMNRDNKKKVAAYNEKLKALDKGLVLELYLAGKKQELAVYLAEGLGLEFPAPAAA